MINSNFSPILHRFGDMAAYRQFYLLRPHLTPLLWGTPQNFGMNLAFEKLEGWGYRMVNIS